MIGKIIQWSLQNRLLVLLVAGLMMVWGAYETSRMPVDVFPDLTAPTVTVVTEAHGMAPEEVEKRITFQIETAVNGAAGVRRVRSISDVGLSLVIVEFDWGTDIYRARQIVSEKLQLARSALPKEIDAPILAPVTSIMGEIMFIALVSDKHSAMDLRSVARWKLRQRLRAIPGVAEVIPYGGETKQYQVRIKPQRLAAYHITIGEVIEALRKSNANTSAGFYTSGGQDYLIHGQGRIKKISDIGNTHIVTRGGHPVLVRHVAEIKIGAAPSRGSAAYNAKSAVVIGIQKQPDTSTLDLTRRIDLELATLQKQLPKGMVIKTDIFRQSDFITRSIDNLSSALRDGAILVIAIVFIFLFSWRSTVITLVALPLSLLMAILCLRLLDASINTMTLGGMAIALGALVDDAIIVVENIVRRMRLNAKQAKPSSSLKVVFEATREIQGSIVFATIIIILVFLPLLFLSGVEGRLMQPLGIAYMVSLAASLLVAITVTPVLSLWMLSDKKIIASMKEPAFIKRMQDKYDAWLDYCLQRWKAVAYTASILLLLALLALAFSGRSFLPDFNEGSLTISVVALPGTSLEYSDKLGQRVEKILHSHPEVVATGRRTGRAELDPHAQGVHASEIEVTLKMKDRNKEEFLVALRKDLAGISGANIVIGQPISHRIDHMLSGTRANIAIKIFGDDLYELRKAAKRVETIAKGVPGAVDVAMEQQADIPFVSVKFRRASLARYGLHIQDINEALEVAFNGHAVSKILEGEASYDLVVRYDPAVKASEDSIRSTLFTTASGAHVPLHALADISFKERRPNTISREDVQRKIVVMVNVAGRDLGSVVSDIREQVNKSIKGFRIEYGGQFESAERASRTLMLLGIVVILGIFLLLFMAFRSIRDSLLVMLNLPLALIGGVIGVWLSGGVTSIASIIGFITLFGIATRNGVMMISHFHHLARDEGIKDITEIVKRGARERLVPILMTALAAGLALVPLALSSGEAGSEIQAPMAIVILAGLLTSTALNMLVVPTLYRQFGELALKFK